MKEKVKEIMSELGFIINEVVENVYTFECEQLHCLLMFNSNDEKYVQFCVPYLLERNEIDDADFNKLMEHLNSELKYVKCYELGNALSIFYERYIDSEIGLDKVIKHIINWIAYGALEARKQIRDIKNEKSEDD
ncbi:MAG: hypothetical protein KBT40_04345 [bacterium]|nr:hypothetical protein [Candidatus Minthenecus merdequi]